MRQNFCKTLLVLTVLFLGVSCKKGNEEKEKKQEVKREVVKNELKAFDYMPKMPVNGKLKGVVELGASGFNLFIIEVDKDKNWRVTRKEFGNSLIAESMTSSKEVKNTLREYIQKIFKLGVKSKDIHFVVSSGAAKEKITKKISSALKRLGYFVNIITPEKEAQYAFVATLPKGYEGKAFVVDMGSGNTKISYMQDGKIVGKETYGAKYFKKNIDSKIVYDDVKEKVSNIPVENTKTCFIIGGVPYNMAKLTRKDKERYTVLFSDVSKYNSLVQKKGEKIVSGLNIYKSILDNSNCDNVVFDWDSNFSIGFLLSLSY